MSISKQAIINNILNSYIEKGMEDLTGKIKNDPNYYPVTISYRMKNGTLVRKREYVKNTDPKEIKYSLKQQRILEKRESDEGSESLVGRPVKVKWRGDSSITPFTTEDAEISGSDPNTFTIKLTKPFATMNSENYVYPAGALLKIPKTTNPEWVKTQARVKVQEVGTSDKPTDKDIEDMEEEEQQNVNQNTQQNVTPQQENNQPVPQQNVQK